jgi:hypothetical protein
MGSRPRKVTASWQRAYFIAPTDATDLFWKPHILDRVTYIQIAAAMAAAAGFVVARALHNLLAELSSERPGINYCFAADPPEKKLPRLSARQASRRRKPSSYNWKHC